MGGITKLSKKLADKRKTNVGDQGVITEVTATTNNASINTLDALTITNRGANVNPKTLTLFKLLGITSLCLSTIAIVSLNLVTTYHTNHSSIANAVESTNTANLANASSSPYISLSLTNIATGSTDDPNLVLQIPHEGGIATGGHTLIVKSNAENGYTLSLSTTSNNTDLVNEESNNTIGPIAGGTTDNPVKLGNNTWGWMFANAWQHTGGNEASNTEDVLKESLETYKLIEESKDEAIWISPSSKDFPWLIADHSNSTYPEYGGIVGYLIIYGARVDDPTSTLAGDYRAEVVYTATAKLPPAPTVTSVNPSTYELGSGSNDAVTITGTNLSSTYSAYVDLDKDGQKDAGEECTNLSITNNTTIACDIPTSGTIEPGSYPIRVVAQGGEAKLDNGITYTKPSTCTNADPDSDCQVDIDANMIPIRYEGNEDSPKWVAVSENEIKNDTGSWYNYHSQKWANAVTLVGGGAPDLCYEVAYDSETKTTSFYRHDSNNGDIWKCNEAGSVIGPEDAARQALELLENNQKVLLYKWDTSKLEEISEWVIPEGDILGYWVYIPRYAYEVMRPNAIDRVVDDETAKAEGGFQIKFETAEDVKKTPAPTCNILNPTMEQMWTNGTPTANAGSDNPNILAKDYRTQCGIDRTYPGNDQSKADQTTWATHPAFSWQYTKEAYGFNKTIELNGIWVGKFETTGTKTNPTIKPNQHANISQTIGEFYTMAKSIGVEDENNVGGNTISGITQNSHGLNKATSHMMKNSEWGAATYLASSQYGAGVNEVQINSAYPTISADADGQDSRYGATGCGPSSDGSTSTYTDGTALSSTTIESETACSQDKSRAYYGELGQLASTTNNVYGIYDMAGGVSEYVMGNKTTSDTQTTGLTTYFKTPTKEPYVNLYRASDGFGNKPAWSSGSDEWYYNNDICTWNTCGGHALYETKKTQSVSHYDQSWGSDYSSVANSSYPWFVRGGSADSNLDAGPFNSNGNSGTNYPYYSFRSVLSATN